jgi:hypothetical protein
MSRDTDSVLSEERRRKVDELRKLGELRGFTREYQQDIKKKENEICHKKRAPATDERYGRAVENWKTYVVKNILLFYLRDIPDSSPDG